MHFHNYFAVLGSCVACLVLLAACTSPLSHPSTAAPTPVADLPPSAQAAALLAHLADEPDDFFLALHAGPDAGDLDFTLTPSSAPPAAPNTAAVQITPAQARALITALDQSGFFAHAVDPQESPYTRGLTAAIHLYSSVTGPRIEYLGWDLGVITRFEALRVALTEEPAATDLPQQTRASRALATANPPRAALDALLTRLAPLKAYWQQPWQDLGGNIQCRLRPIALRPPRGDTADAAAIELTLRNNSPDPVTLIAPGVNTRVGLADGWYEFPLQAPTGSQQPSDISIPPGATYTNTIYLAIYAAIHKSLAGALESPGPHAIRVSLPVADTGPQKSRILVIPCVTITAPAPATQP